MTKRRALERSRSGCFGRSLVHATRWVLETVKNVFDDVHSLVWLLTINSAIQFHSIKK